MQLAAADDLSVPHEEAAVSSLAGAKTKDKDKCKKKRQATNRELLGTCANKNSIWSAKIRRLRKIKSSHKLGT